MTFQKTSFQPKQQKIKPLSEYLREQDSVLNELLHVLDEERRNLRDRDVKGLNSVNERKSSLMIKLQGNDQRIKLHPQVAELKLSYAETVKKLKDKMVSCKHKNEINGALIKMCMNANRRIGAVLMNARDSVTRNLTYNDKGNVTARGPQRVNLQA